ncbi:MAG TPA: ParM/StbA family protein, partial [Bacillus sp. (in: firmicutes)]|nr:ParM/StbA family protein [Bacillus sp. (in: firmicutes)]
SFLDREGDIQSFVISTVIAPAPSDKINVKDRVVKDMNIEDFLHVRVKSDSLSQGKTNSYWYVGPYAKDKADRIEPNIVVHNNNNEKFSQNKYKNNLHVIVSLTGLAVAALKAGLSEVTVPYSGGLPFKEYKEVGEDNALKALQGQHVVEFIDGAYEGRVITINIENGSIYAEGSTSYLPLTYNIEKGELVETKLAEELGDNYALGDLGAGTSDLVLFDENGINKELSGENKPIGTNAYIDELMDAIKNRPEFADILKDSNNPNASPYKTREQFMSTVIEPEILKMIEHDQKGEEYNPTFKARWTYVKNVDVTDLVMSKLTEYGKKQFEEIMAFWSNAAEADSFVIVGGGLLFGYPVFRKYKDRFVFPPDIKEAQFSTSRSYLIANFLDHYIPYVNRGIGE